MSNTGQCNSHFHPLYIFKKLFIIVENWIELNTQHLNVKHLWSGAKKHLSVSISEI